MSQFFGSIGRVAPACRASADRFPLDRLGIDGERFIAYSERFLTAFGSAVGAPQALTDLCARRQTKYLRGMQAARQLFLAKRAA